jgi:membrane-associated protease RseP (regulator of RpoE activity)
MRPLRAPMAALLLAALACGPRGGADGEAPAVGSPLEADLASARLEVATLRQALDEERQERQALEAEVEWLREQLESAGWEEPAADAPEAEGDADVPAATPEAGEKHAERPWFDAEALAKHGVPPSDVDLVRESFDASELALLNLEDQARREGWFDKPRYRLALRDQRVALRADLGDERFDALLFATGRRNRVVVTDLLDESPAQRAGLEPGDEILSYGESRVFGPMELKAATTAGTAGERVEIVVLRDGARERFFAPRGPLGIRMRPASRPPAP